MTNIVPTLDIRTKAMFLFTSKLKCNKHIKTQTTVSTLHAIKNSEQNYEVIDL